MLDGPGLDVDTREAAQRRTLTTLTISQATAAAPPALAVAVGAIVVEGILGPTRWAGVASASVTFGAAVLAPRLADLARRYGRRPALVIGYLAAGAGAALAAAGTQMASLWLLVPALGVFGAGQAASNQARFAATDLASEESRAAAMGRVVFAATFGAVVGPLLGGPSMRAAHALGVQRFAGPWLAAMVLYIGAATFLVARLRPDPLRLAGGAGGVPVRSRRTEGFGDVASTPRARLAVGATAIAQAAMVAVMAMTPPHMSHLGIGHHSGYVISGHVIGMFALSPLVGRFSDRFGRDVTIVCGAALLVVAGLMAATSGENEPPLWVALFLLGLGWSFCLIGGSTMLSESVATDRRVAAQGTSDLLMALGGGVAGLASGFIRRAWGFDRLAMMAMLAAGFLLAWSATATLRGRRQRAATLDQAGV